MIRYLILENCGSDRLVDWINEKCDSRHHEELLAMITHVSTTMLTSNPPSLIPQGPSSSQVETSLALKRNSQDFPQVQDETEIDKPPPRVLHDPRSAEYQREYISKSKSPPASPEIKTILEEDEEMSDDNVGKNEDSYMGVAHFGVFFGKFQPNFVKFHSKTSK